MPLVVDDRQPCGCSLSRTQNKLEHIDGGVLPPERGLLSSVGSCRTHRKTWHKRIIIHALHRPIHAAVLRPCCFLGPASPKLPK